MSALQNLLALSGPALAEGVSSVVLPTTPLDAELRGLLAQRNGFYALDRALHVLPSVVDTSSLAPWNDPASWRSDYSKLAEPFRFFAHDLFGNPFAFLGSEVVMFNAETGDHETVAKTLKGWAEALLSDDYWSGSALATDWQVRYGELKEGQRLVPKIPFVMGGSYDLTNLYAGDAVESLRFRGSLAQQLRNIPDGTTVELSVIKGRESGQWNRNGAGD